MSFEDFLDMMSVFSDNAPRSLKAEYAFKIYGKFYLYILLFKNKSNITGKRWWLGSGKILRFKHHYY